MRPEHWLYAAAELTHPNCQLQQQAIISSSLQTKRKIGAKNGNNCTDRHNKVHAVDCVYEKWITMRCNFAYSAMQREEIARENHKVDWIGGGGNTHTLVQSTKLKCPDWIAKYRSRSTIGARFSLLKKKQPRLVCGARELASKPCKSRFTIHRVHRIQLAAYVRFLALPKWWCCFEKRALAIHSCLKVWIKTTSRSNTFRIAADTVWRSNGRRWDISNDDCYYTQLTFFHWIESDNVLVCCSLHRHRYWTTIPFLIIHEIHRIPFRIYDRLRELWSICVQVSGIEFDFRTRVRHRQCGVPNVHRTQLNQVKMDIQK